jgi:hypothetical protein
MPDLQSNLDLLDPWEGLANGDDPLYEFSGGGAEIIDKKCGASIGPKGRVTDK